MQFHPSIVHDYIYNTKKASFDDPQSYWEPSQLTAALPISKFMGGKEDGLASLKNYGVPAGLVNIPTAVSNTFLLSMQKSKTVGGDAAAAKVSDKPMFEKGGLFGGKKEEEGEPDNETEDEIPVLTDTKFDQIVGGCMKTVRTDTRKNHKAHK
jgi:hypothetical protein